METKPTSHPGPRSTLSRHGGPGGQPASGPVAVAPRRIDSRTLLSGQRELIIQHGGCEYRLRRARNDRLILTR